MGSYLCTLCMFLCVFCKISSSSSVYSFYLHTQIQAKAGTRDFVVVITFLIVCFFRSSNMFFLFSLIGYCPLLFAHTHTQKHVTTLSYSHIEFFFISFEMRSCCLYTNTYMLVCFLAMHKLYARSRPKPNSIKTAILAKYGVSEHDAVQFQFSFALYLFSSTLFCVIFASLGFSCIWFSSLNAAQALKHTHSRRSCCCYRSFWCVMEQYSLVGCMIPYALEKEPKHIHMHVRRQHSRKPFEFIFLHLPCKMYWISVFIFCLNTIGFLYL